MVSIFARLSAPFTSFASILHLSRQIRWWDVCFMRTLPGHSSMGSEAHLPHLPFKIDVYLEGAGP